ncbi:MAG: cytochrome c biogenesis protein CcsA [Armatimonadota bacterium]|nr:cytochrome c biogenesis protein CcsA [Armatimonadota bacterium]MDR5698105.1 cytochrome c biogenesis protein CcsA [Armatimonadota bacterium]
MRRVDSVLWWTLVVAMVASLYMVFLYAPTERIMGPVQRIFYFHLALAWVAFVAFFGVFVGGIQYLRTRSTWWDELAAGSAEVGVWMNGLVIVTGSIWARPTWGVWWTWDPQVTATLIMQLMYMGYLLLRSAADDERRARFAAAFGVIAFLNVPIVFFSARLLRGISPVVFTRQGIGLEPEMLYTLLVCLAAFSLLYAVLLGVRMRIALLRAEVARMRAELAT